MSALINFFKEVFIFIIAWIISTVVFIIVVENMLHIEKTPLVSFTGIIIPLIVAFYATNFISKRKARLSKTPLKTKKKNKVRARDKESIECVFEFLSKMEKSKNDNTLAEIAECVKDKPEKKRKKIIEAALMQYIEKALEDGLLDENEENTIVTVADEYGIDISGIDELKKAKVLYSIVHGDIPEVKVNGTLPVLLKNDEKLIWAVHNVGLMKIVTKTKYVGGSDGISIRIAKGLYYRKSAFKGHRVSEKSKEIVDVGTLIITNKNIFFVGDEEKLKFQIDKLVSIEPYEDGIVLQKSGNAKPVTFIGIDGWFAYNLVTNLYSMQ